MMLTMLGLIAVHAAAPAMASGQQLYDRAQAAYDRGDWQVAADEFGRLLPSLKTTGRAAAIVRVRMAEALIKLGRAAEARAAAAAAVATLKTGPAGLELANAWLTLGTAARFDLAYPEAVAAFRAADALAGLDPSGAVRLSAAMGLMLAATVTDPDSAARAADVLIADPGFAALPKLQQAEYYSIRARIELNRGAAKAALPYVRKAVALHGPLDSRVGLVDLMVRGDAALVYQQLGDQDQARRFFAYTGAGHLPSMNWINGDKTLPTCDDEVRPDDTAIVEFAIGSDGRIEGAAPIYASRPGEMGVVFAQAVRSWRLAPGDAAKLDPLWRASVRLQLRCMTRPEPESMAAPFADATDAWTVARGLAPDPLDKLAPLSRGDTPAAVMMQAAATAAAKAGGAAAWQAAFAKLDRQLSALAAPTEVRAMAANLTATAERRSGSGWAAVRAAKLAAAIPLIDAMPGSARAAAWLRTERALALERTGAFTAARPLLEQALATPVAALPTDDVIRAVATLHLSLIERRAGEHAAADARLTKAGLNADSCALYDVRPVATNAAISVETFPMEAVRWGFEGYVLEAFDVDADGSVSGVRTVIAYPPFIFGDATEKAVRRFRYEAPSLGGKALGCSAQTQSVRFVLPH